MPTGVGEGIRSIIAARRWRRYIWHMRVAVLSDVHGNLGALEATLEAADAAGATEYWFLGDAVDYGARPNETCALLKACMTRAIAGNHDLLAAGMTDPHMFSDWALEYADHTARTLESRWRDWLAGLPLGLQDAQTTLRHGSPEDPVWGYVTLASDAESALHLTSTPLLLVGHTHHQGGWRRRADCNGRLRNCMPATGERQPLRSDRLLLNPGSVGAPRAGKDGRAQWLLLDLAEEWFAFQRERYDWRAERRLLEQEGLDAGHVLPIRPQRGA